MKKFISIALVLMLVFAAFGCAAPAAPAAPAESADPAASAAPAAPAAPAPAPAEEDDEIVIGFLYQDLFTEFWVCGYDIAMEELKAAGVTILERNANSDANTQIEQLNDVIAQGVDGVLCFSLDGDSGVALGKIANEAGVPIAFVNKPPTDQSYKYIVANCDNDSTAYETVKYMVEQAVAKFEATGEKLTPLIMVGDLADPNAVARKDGYYRAIGEHPEVFNDTIESPTKWDANTGLANLESAMQANPDVDFIFTSSDFLYPQIQQVLEPMGKWQVVGHEDHVILGGVDGDSGAAALMDAGYVDATGVQDLFYECGSAIEALLASIEAGEATPENWIIDPGFALTQANMAERRSDMWGCVVLDAKQ